MPTSMVVVAEDATSMVAVTEDDVDTVPTSMVVVTIQYLVLCEGQDWRAVDSEA